MYSLKLLDFICSFLRMYLISYVYFLSHSSVIVIRVDKLEAKKYLSDKDSEILA